MVKLRADSGNVVIGVGRSNTVPTTPAGFVAQISGFLEDLP